MAQYKGAASEAGRAMQLMKKREKEREQLEQLKLKIAEDNMVKSNIDKKFSAHYDAVEAELKSSTVGLVTLNDMKAKQEALVKEREKQLAKKEQSKELQLNRSRSLWHPSSGVLRHPREHHGPIPVSSLTDSLRRVPVKFVRVEQTREAEGEEAKGGAEEEDRQFIVQPGGRGRRGGGGGGRGER
uniref:Family with sequence similarity 50 member A n=1 Tax=Cyclopterus lumpus TaxID=8103 RepID=A0A8C2XLH7_CYCLU